MNEDLSDLSADATAGVVPSRDLAAVTVKSAYKIKRSTGQFELTPRHKLLATYMAHGCDHPRARRLGIALNVPLSLSDAAAVLDIRKRNAREISMLPSFQKLLLSLTAALRTGEHSRSVQTLIDMRDAPGEGSAADRKVRIDAAKALIGADEKNLSIAVNVGVGVNNQTAGSIVPGYCIDLSGAAPPTIDGHARDVTPAAIDMPVRQPAHDEFDEFKRRWGPGHER